MLCSFGCLYCWLECEIECQKQNQIIVENVEDATLMGMKATNTTQQLQQVRSNAMCISYENALHGLPMLRLWFAALLVG